MTGDRPPSPFERARDELRAIGIKLSMHPGTYCVNFSSGSTEATAYFSDDLADAIEHGREMAASALAGFIERGRRAQEAADKIIAAATAAGKPVRYKRRRKMTPKAFNRRLRKQHMRRLRAKTIRQLAPRGDDQA